MPKDYAFLTRKELAERWNVSTATLNKWMAEKKIKPNKITNLFSMTYIEAIEREGIDLDTVGVFRLRALERENERLREENAMLKSTLFQISSMANEATSKVIRERIF
ncbi:MAG: hypothetical protein VB047_10860 [Anaerotignum propionicum]|uniref:hypothetical protein n=1 Tax=Anaerotignum propionicum TaxID=28446 RepID=UPI002B1EB8CC|nr:hypothetical protein [Anaerotignum propionicum]MEA5058043.1 hypothetical protein [Anaerotignum propionicum]